MLPLILFPAGVRLSTWLCAAAFVALAVRRRDTVPLAAAWVWFVGFEAAFQLTGTIATPSSPAVMQVVGTRWLVIAVGLTTVIWFTRHGVRPWMPLLTATALIWLVWVAAGFHANMHTTVGFDATAEAFNEAAKVALALAYLVPLLRLDAMPRVDAAAAARDAAPADLRAKGCDARIPD